MNKLMLVLVATMFVGSSNYISAKKYYKQETQPKLNIGYDLKLGDNYSGGNFHLGASITDNFVFDRKAYWKIGAEFNWNKYYSNNYESIFDSYYSYENDFSVLKTNSFSIPVEFGYEIDRSLISRTYIFGGPVYDYIFNARLNGSNFNDFKRGLWGVNFGVKLNVIKLFDLKASYSFFPDYMYNNGNFSRSSLNFSIGI